jgi:hypothetical protein
VAVAAADPFAGHTNMSDDPFGSSPGEADPFATISVVASSVPASSDPFATISVVASSVPASSDPFASFPLPTGCSLYFTRRDVFHYLLLYYLHPETVSMQAETDPFAEFSTGAPAQPVITQASPTIAAATQDVADIQEEVCCYLRVLFL